MTRPPPIRLAVVLHDPDRDGARASELIARLRPDWFEPELWLLRKPAGPRAKRELAALKVVQVSDERTGMMARMRLGRRLWRTRPALLYAFGAPPDAWTRLLGGLLRIPLVAGYSGPTPCRYERLLRRFSARILTDSAELKHIVTTRCAVEPDQITVATDAQQTERALIEVAQRSSAWTTTAEGDTPLELPLDPAPAAVGPPDTIEERGTFRPDRSFRFVARPTITVFLPPPAGATGAAAIICPGGAYAGVTIDKEGFDVARWLAASGVAGVVLKYRLPRPDLTRSATPMPIEDLSRALTLVRGRAGEWNIDPERIGVMGFSAGGHMAAVVAQAGEPPAFAALIYPVISMQTALAHRPSRQNLLGRSPSPTLVDHYSLERHVTPRTPPSFLVHARDDDVVDVDNSIRYAEALRAAGVPHELLLYERGGHGFGLARNGAETATWPARLLAWLRARHLLERAAQPG